MLLLRCSQLMPSQTAWPVAWPSVRMRMRSDAPAVLEQHVAHEPGVVRRRRPVSWTVAAVGRDADEQPPQRPTGAAAGGRRRGFERLRLARRCASRWRGRRASGPSTCGHSSGQCLAGAPPAAACRAGAASTRLGCSGASAHVGAALRSAGCGRGLHFAQSADAARSEGRLAWRRGR